MHVLLVGLLLAWGPRPCNVSWPGFSGPWLGPVLPGPVRLSDSALPGVLTVQVQKTLRTTLRRI